MPEQRGRGPLSDLERKVYRAMVAEHVLTFPDSPLDGAYLNKMAKTVVQVLTTGSASGRRLQVTPRRLPDPGCTPDKIRQLARTIEDSFADMPQGWVRQRDLEGGNG